MTSFDADIALLIPDDVIPFTKLIKPICLWESSTDPTVTEGYIAGWGLSATSSKDYEPVPNQLKVPIHQGEDCLLYNPIFTQVSSKRTICGGSKNGAGPCLGEIIKMFKVQSKLKASSQATLDRDFTSNKATCSTCVRSFHHPY